MFEPHGPTDVEVDIADSAGLCWMCGEPTDDRRELRLEGSRWEYLSFAHPMPIPRPIRVETRAPCCERHTRRPGALPLAWVDHGSGRAIVRLPDEESAERLRAGHADTVTGSAERTTAARTPWDLDADRRPVRAARGFLAAGWLVLLLVVLVFAGEWDRDTLGAVVLVGTIAVLALLQARADLHPHVPSSTSARPTPRSRDVEIDLDRPEPGLCWVCGDPTPNRRGLRLRATDGAGTLGRTIPCCERHPEDYEHRALRLVSLDHANGKAVLRLPDGERAERLREGLKGPLRLRDAEAAARLRAGLSAAPPPASGEAETGYEGQ